MVENCLFCKIVAGDIPSKKAYEDDKILAFYDIAPQAPVHILVIPKAHIASVDEIGESNADVVAHIFTKIPSIAKDAGITLPKQKTVHASLEAIKYPYTGEEGWAIRSKLCASDYGKGQTVCIKVKDVCNWLLHSYVWGIARNENGKGFAGFLVASDFDKEKFVHFVSFEEWNALLKVVMKNSTL